MTEDLLSLEEISGLTIEESTYASDGDDYDVIPQRLDNFKKVTDPHKSRITIGEDDTTKIKSHGLRAHNDCTKSETSTLYRRRRIS